MEEDPKAAIALPSQPPPGVEPPPPGPEAVRSQKIMSRIIGGGVVCTVLLMVIGLAGLSRPLNRRVSSDRTEAMWNIKQVGLALQEFDSEYNTFPDATTIARVKAASHTTLTLGDGSSNELFRQLLATGLKTERPFYARSARSRRPDNDFSDDAHALAPGECGFAYVLGLSSSGDPQTPVVMAPMIPGTPTFDRGPFDGKALILRLDNSASFIPLDSSGHAKLNGMDPFDPRQPFWHGKTPDIRWQE